jgi:hypothetical protein
MKKSFFITYGDKKYKNSKNRIIKEAEDSKMFDNIKAYGPNDVDKEIFSHYKDILKLARGNGYWLWKFLILKETLNIMEKDDILVYADAGCRINKNGYKRYTDYKNMLNESNLGIISFIGNVIEKHYTTQEILSYFNITPEDKISNSPHLQATVLILKKCPHAESVIDKCLEVVNFDPKLITDYYNSSNKNNYFKENRHDQSILSVVRKIMGSIMIPQETYSTKFNSPPATDWPFLATRIRG